MVSKPKVLILVGSDSDLKTIETTMETLESFEIGYECRIHSAHRTPNEAKALVSTAHEKGFSLIIAAAGLAAHLPGVCAAFTHLPVIGIPINSGDLNGVDALYSIVMMPPGVPVASVGIGKSGAKNAAVLAAQILSLRFPSLEEKVKQFKIQQTKDVLKKDETFRRSKDF